LTRNDPYPGNEIMLVAVRVAKGEISLMSFLPQPNNYSPILVQIMKDCLQFNPASRPEFKDILKSLPN